MDPSEIELSMKKYDAFKTRAVFSTCDLVYEDELVREELAEDIDH